MSLESITCPFCNSTVILPSSLPNGQRLRCARCQEIVPYELGKVATRSWGTGDLNSNSSELNRYLDPAGEQEPKHLKNSSIAKVILSVMFIMAGIALFFAWITVEKRRSRDFGPGSNELVKAVPTSPSRLAGLGHLPDDVEFIAAIHLAELRENDHAGKLIDDFGQAYPQFDPRRLAALTGIEVEEIDHVILGAKVSLLVPRVTLVVHTRRPYHLERLRTRLQAAGRVEKFKRTIYSFLITNQGLSTAYLWCPSDRFAVFAIAAADFETVPLSPEPGTGRFNPSLERMLTEELHEGTQAWLIGNSPNVLSNLAAATLIAKADKQTKELLGELRVISTWLECDEDVKWSLIAGGADDLFANRLGDFLERKGIAFGKPFKWEGTSWRSKKIESELTESLRIHTEGGRLHLKSKAATATLREALLASDKAK